MEKHTPGPWVVEYDNADDRSGGQWYQAGPAKVCYPYSASKERRETALADARLIAAAPRMFDRIAKLAADGDVEAINIMESINGNA